jgi:hypothetical protein
MAARPLHVFFADVEIGNEFMDFGVLEILRKNLRIHFYGVINLSVRDQFVSVPQKLCQIHESRPLITHLREKTKIPCSGESPITYRLLT